jgi:hypothetical protein
MPDNNFQEATVLSASQEGFTICVDVRVVSREPVDAICDLAAIPVDVVAAEDPTETVTVPLRLAIRWLRFEQTVKRRCSCSHYLRRLSHLLCIIRRIGSPEPLTRLWPISWHSRRRLSSC